MIKSHVKDLKLPDIVVFLAAISKKAFRAVLSFRPGDVLSADTKYKLHFYRSFLPELYRNHIRRNHKNCIFCSHLLKAGCHKYCLKCSIGTYIKCYPPLPGLLYKGSIFTDDEDVLPVPWYFKKVCENFSRLPQSQYFRNLYSIFPSIAFNNYEVLESLEKGMLSGIRPCYICASVDYDLYKRCTRQDYFDMSVPCHRIKRELKKVYSKKPSTVRSAV